VLPARWYVVLYRDDGANRVELNNRELRRNNAIGRLFKSRA
jgi:hypothetical protein